MGELERCNSVAMSRLSFRKALFGTGWAVSFLLCTIGLRKTVLSPRAFISSIEGYSQSEQAVVG